MDCCVPTNTERRTTTTTSGTPPPPSSDSTPASDGASSSLLSSIRTKRVPSLPTQVQPLPTRRGAHSKLEQHAAPVTHNRQPVLMLATTHKRRRRTNPDGTKTVLPNQAERRVCSIPGCNKKTPKLCTVCGKPVCDWERRPLCWKTHCDEHHTDVME